MNKKRYTAPQMKITKLETLGFIANSGFQTISRGHSSTYDDSENEEEIPSVDPYGNVFGD